MCKLCPPGWNHVSCPSEESGYELDLPDYQWPLSSVTITNRSRTGTYKWEKAKGALGAQTACGEKRVITVFFEVSEEHSLNVGTLFNLGTEAIEISGGYEYSFGNTAGTSIEATVGEANWEYLAIPLVLGLTICNSETRNGAPWYFFSTHGHAHYFSYTRCAKPLYIRGGLLICRRWCGDPAEEPKHASVEDQLGALRSVWDDHSKSWEDTLDSYVSTDEEMDIRREQLRTVWTTLRSLLGG